jgi:hypothetical protein
MRCTTLSTTTACNVQYTTEAQCATCSTLARFVAACIYVRGAQWSTCPIHSTHSLIGWSKGTALSGTCQTAPHRQYSKYFQCTTLHTAHQSGHFARLDSPFLGLRKDSTDSFTAAHPLWANAGLHSTTATSVPQRSLCHSEAHRAFTARLARWDEPSCFAARSFSSPNSLELVRRRCGQRCCAATPRPPCRMTCHAE